ncbi:hypothetical protein C0991_008394 [Blastosporella zonata]|nr:hypothetical protein C0991_008394 [Blastosporella zonata]
MTNYGRRPTFNLHSTPYDPPAPTLAPVPLSAPNVAPVVADGDDDGPNSSLLPPSTANGSGNGRPARNSRAVVQAELAETISIMRDNIQSLSARGERLESLESRTENLVVAARGFRKSSNKVRNAMWWKDMKMRLIIALAVSVVVGLTILSIVQAVRHKNNQKIEQKQSNVQAKVAPQVPVAVATPAPRSPDIT